MSRANHKEGTAALRSMDDWTEQQDLDVASDRSFFLLRPHRRYRLRPLLPSERQLVEAMKDSPEEFYMLVEQLSPGVRIRASCIGKPDFRTEWDDNAIELLILSGGLRRLPS